MIDSYVKAFIKVHVHVDAGQRVWCKNEQLQVHVIGGVKKVALPVSKHAFTFDELKQCGARVDVVTLRSLARQGAEGRWAEQIQERRENGLPSNVYIANARSIQYAIDHDKTPPDVKYVGRMRDKITETYDTVDEVVDALDKNLWRTEFRRGRYAKRGKK
jgi:hypothetical protein